MQEIIKQLNDRLTRIKQRLDALTHEADILQTEQEHIEGLLSQYHQKATYYSYIEPAEEKVPVPAPSPATQSLTIVGYKRKKGSRSTPVTDALNEYLTYSGVEDKFTTGEIRQYATDVVGYEVSCGSVSFWLQRQLNAGTIIKKEKGIYEKRKDPQ